MKKLLAVVLSAAMVLGMSATAFAANTAETLPATISISKGGELVVNVSVNEEKWNLINETHITYDTGKGKPAFKASKEFNDALYDQDQMINLVFNNNVEGDIAITQASISQGEDTGAPINYKGVIATITFTADQLPVTVKCGSQEVKLGEEATDAPATDAPSTDAPATDAPATDAPSTDAPATDAPATDVPASDAPATDAPGGSGTGSTGTGSTGTGSGTGSTGTGSTGTGSGTGSTGTGSGTSSTGKGTGSTGTGSGSGSASAAKTADVAPIVTFAILALAAGVVVVNMKKKVTE